VDYQSFYYTPTELYDAELEIAEVNMNEEEAAEFEEDFTVPDWDLTVVFLIAAFQFFSTVMTFSIGKPFRKPFYTNWLFTFCLFYTTVSIIGLILIPIQPLYDLLGLRMFDSNNYFRWVILAVALINGLITILYEAYGVQLILTGARKVKRLFKRNKNQNNTKKELDD